MNTNEGIVRKRALSGGVCIVAGMVALAGANAARAAVVYDTFGPNGEFGQEDSWVSGNLFGTVSWNAMAFQLGAGTFSNISVTVPLSLAFSNDPDSFEFYLRIYADDGENQTFGGAPFMGGPGTLIDSRTLNAGTDIPNQAGPATFQFNNAVLEGNTRYWVSLETELPADGYINWYMNTIEHEGPLAQRAGNSIIPFPSIWTMVDGLRPSSAMRIDATIVPAPGALALLALGMIPVGRRQRR